MDDSIDSKSKPLHPSNIWNENINSEVNDSHIILFFTITINIGHYYLQFSHSTT
jgi:hypothetical protein